MPIMSDAPKTPVAPRPASTVVILRDGAEGIEVFMVERHRQIDFASGALVFPGGKVDPEDSDAAWGELAAQAPAAPDRSLFVAAGRETFEEAGLVLARQRGTRDIVDADAAHRLVDRHRAGLLKGEATFVDIVRSEGLELALDLMVPFAHWITPERIPKRFDTHFFLIAAPVVQLGAHDGSESVEGLWITPQRALSEAESGKRSHAGVRDAYEPHQAGALCDRGRGGSRDPLEARSDGDPQGEEHARGPLAADPRRCRLRRHRGVRRGRLDVRQGRASRLMLAVIPELRVSAISGTQSCRARPG
jgi:8-oxo-dGTP pyrophosphatase MutT (NUDIX family)